MIATVFSAPAVSAVRDSRSGRRIVCDIEQPGAIGCEPLHATGQMQTHQRSIDDFVIQQLVEACRLEQRQHPRRVLDLHAPSQ